MGALIPIQQDNGVNTVNARDLHSFLGSKQDFSDWMKKRIKQYGFVEEADFTKVHKKMELSKTGQHVIEYYLTIDMAKELSMVERNSKGKQARQYFIECERLAKDPSLQIAQQPKSEILLLAAKQAETIEKQEEQLQLQAPKVLFADAVSSSHTSILVGELAKLICQNGVKIGAGRLFTYLRENGFLIKRKGSDWNMPTQYSMERKLFEIKERSVINGDGSTRLTRTPKVTGKGQVYFVNKMVGEAQA